MTEEKVGADKAPARQDGAGKDSARAAADGDTARAEIQLPLPPEDVFVFLRQIALAYRLNPLLAIELWIPAESGFRFTAHNESNDRRSDIGVRLDVEPASQTITLRYDTGLKQSTRLQVEASGSGSRLVVTEAYPQIDDPADPRVAEVDKSLVPWVAAIRRHLIQRRRWGWLPGWLWWNERFLPGMPPRSRRIVRLIVWISALEFAVFIGAVVVLRLAS